MQQLCQCYRGLGSNQQGSKSFVARMLISICCICCRGLAPCCRDCASGWLCCCRSAAVTSLRSVMRATHWVACWMCYGVTFHINRLNHTQVSGHTMTVKQAFMHCIVARRLCTCRHNKSRILAHPRFHLPPTSWDVPFALVECCDVLCKTPVPFHNTSVTCFAPTPPLHAHASGGCSRMAPTSA